MKRRRKRPEALWHPIYWPTWLGLAIFRLLVLLPWKLQTVIGRLAGRGAYHLLRSRRHVVNVNLRLCFPEWNDAQRRVLAIRHFEAMGIGVFETAFAWWAPDRRMPEFRFEGIEHLENAAARGKGVVVLTAHFTTLEICGRRLSEVTPLGCLFRDPDNAVIANEMHRQRLAKMSVAVPMNDLRGLIRALRDGHRVWYAPDQGKRSKFSSILPFFGEPAQTNTATSRIAAMSGAPVVPYFGSRQPDGSYLIRLLPALENFPTADPEADAVYINELLEKNIREAPEQYFWVHRRFKRRGPGFPNVYK